MKDGDFSLNAEFDEIRNMHNESVISEEVKELAAELWKNSMGISNQSQSWVPPAVCSFQRQIEVKVQALLNASTARLRESEHGLQSKVFELLREKDILRLQFKTCCDLCEEIRKSETGLREELENTTKNRDDCAAVFKMDREHEQSPKESCACPSCNLHRTIRQLREQVRDADRAYNYLNEEANALKRHLESEQNANRANVKVIAGLREQLERLQSVVDSAAFIGYGKAVTAEIEKIQTKREAMRQENEQRKQDCINAVKSVLDARDLLSPGTNLSLNEAAEVLRQRNEELLRAGKLVLASAFPTEKEQPAMTAAFRELRIAIDNPKANNP